MKKQMALYKIMMVASMLIVGSIGIFVENIPLPRSAIAFSRAFIGTIVILPAFLLKSKSFKLDAMKKNLLPLLLSGIALGFNWMFLFEAYNYTSVQVATLCYYMAPVFVIIVSPLFLKEKLTPVSIICTIGAVLGAVLISGVFGGGNVSMTGITLGLIAAMLYASIIILNKKISDISGIERTFFQLLISAVVMFIYVIITEDVSLFSLDANQGFLLVILGVVHTGIVYILFFTAVSKLSAQTASILSYIDPVAAIVLSSIFLDEKMTLIQIAGMVLIIGFAMFNEIIHNKKA